MNESIFGRHNLGTALLAALMATAPAVLSVGLLYVVAAALAEPFDSKYVALAAVVGVLAVVILRPGLMTADQTLAGRASLVMSTIGRWLVFLGVLFALGYITKSSSDYSRLLVLVWAAVTPVCLGALEIMFNEMARRGGIARGRDQVAVFAGCNEVSLALGDKLALRPDTGIRVAGFFDDRSLDRLGAPPTTRLLGRLPELAGFVKAKRVDMIFVTLPMRHIQRVIDLLDDLRDTTASIYYVPDIFVYDLIQARTGQILGMPVVAMCETPFYGYRGVVKRLIDVTIAGVAVLVLAPVFLLVAVAVRLGSRGPAIFKQKRYGLDGEQITIYKFRSMTVTEDGPSIVQARRDDQRITAIGRFLRRTSLDELPQLINVIQGRMSLVGPRPHAVAHNEEYRRLIKGYMIRHKVLPGITGLAQVNGCRGETAQLEEMKARVEFDLEYLRRWSPALDLEILWRTFLMLFRREEKAY
jgi:putative colanic acid biosysnthesis UDP-glucose lipid carrier transferase